MKYDMKKYIDYLTKCMEKEKVKSKCNDDDLRINYKLMSTLMLGDYNTFKQRAGDRLYMLGELKMQQAVALGHKSNVSAYLYCQLKFCRDFFKTKLEDFIALDDEIKEYYIISNYVYRSGVPIENGHMFAICKDDTDYVAYFEPLPEETGFRNSYGEGIPDVKEDNPIFEHVLV